MLALVPTLALAVAAVADVDAGAPPSLLVLPKRDEMAGDTPAARDAAAAIARFLAARFEGGRAVACPAPGGGL